MKHRVLFQLLTFLVILSLSGCGSGQDQRLSSSGVHPPAKKLSIECFVGSASKPATEEAAAFFEKETGVTVHLHFGGSGKMMAQLELGGRGDIYFPGSSDYMEKAKRRKLVQPDTERRVVFLISAINVPRGNPKKIRSLSDLARQGMRIGIARPESVCVGLYAEEVLRKAGLWEKVFPRLVTQTESCAKTAAVVGLRHVDAVLGWRVFEYWNPEKIETILLEPSQVTRIGYIPAAVASVSKEPELAKRFIAFLVSPKGQAIFRRWHYLTEEKEARKFALPTTPVGGEWRRPEEEK